MLYIFHFCLLKILAQAPIRPALPSDKAESADDYLAGTVTVLSNYIFINSFINDPQPRVTETAAMYMLYIYPLGGGKYDDSKTI